MQTFERLYIYYHCSVQFSSVQFTGINVLLSASSSGPRHSNNDIDAVVTRTEN